MVQMYHIFFINPLVEKHLGCFKFLAIMNKAAVNIFSKSPCEMVENLLSICQGMVQLDLEIEQLPNF